MKKWMMAVLIAVTVTATALALTGGEGRSSDGGVRKDLRPYTREDYALALSLMGENYQEMEVEEFEKMAADWTDEAVFHQREAALQRLVYTYDREKENGAFIHVTLAAALDACSTRHYGGYCTAMTPGYRDGVTRVREEEVFGDRYPVFEAEIGYSLSYQKPDGAQLTVGERDGILLAYRTAVQEYLDSRTEQELAEEARMEEGLKREFSRLNEALSTGNMTLTGTALDYYYAYSYGGASNEEMAE